MTLLTANFTIGTPSYLIVEGLEDELFSYKISYNEFEITVNLPIVEFGCKWGKVGSEIYKQTVDTIEISITKEVGDIPSIPTSKHGGRDYTGISKYFEPHQQEFESLARLIYSRIISHFKFILHQPFLDIKNTNKDDFSNPTWIDSNGIDYGCVRISFCSRMIPGMYNDCMDITPLTAENKNKLIDSINNDFKAELYQHIISDAQSAIFNGDLRRAVFELAVACELVVKRKYFSENNISGLAFDYFEDKGRVRATVLELISSMAEDVLNESFKSYSLIDYTNIEYLFRCRNKVAHRGNVVYKDNSGVLRSPDIGTLKEWYISACKLFAWLDSKQI